MSEDSTTKSTNHPFISHVQTDDGERSDASSCSDGEFEDLHDVNLHGGGDAKQQHLCDNDDESEENYHYPSEDDEEASSFTQKTSKTNVTSSTVSSSLNHSQSYSSSPDKSNGKDECLPSLLSTPPNDAMRQSRQSINSTPSPVSMGGVSRHSSDLEFFEDKVSEPVLVLGFDIGHLSRRMQFLVCASGVFCFSLLYGYLQELISVQICNRQLGLFLALMQFTGYTTLSYLLRTYVYKKQEMKPSTQLKEDGTKVPLSLMVPFYMYLGLSLLRAVDLAMTNMAMQYINYPAKTLMKSSRVVFTMIFGVFIARKKYCFMDYFVVLCMVAGLAIFMHADATSSAVFQPLGVMMLTTSLVCDGAISVMSETIMNNYGVGQDEFLFRMYSISLVAIATAAAVKGDLQIGMNWMMQPGTYDEMQQGVSPEEATWSVFGKVMVMILFSCMGFVGSSCSAAVTKNFGALTMSITSTARKATTLFLSFFLFNNVCTTEHLAGVVIFISALTAKSVRRGKHSIKARNRLRRSRSGENLDDLEMQRSLIIPLRGAKISKSDQKPLRSSPNSKFEGTPGRRPNAGKFVSKALFRS